MEDGLDRIKNSKNKIDAKTSKIDYISIKTSYKILDKLRKMDIPDLVQKLEKSNFLFSKSYDIDSIIKSAIIQLLKSEEILVGNLIETSKIIKLIPSKKIGNKYLRYVNSKEEDSNGDPYLIKVPNKNLGSLTIDFSNKNPCTDQTYQGESWGVNCDIIGFFKIDELGENFFPYYTTFGKNTRDIVVLDTDAYKLESFVNFRPIESFSFVKEQEKKPELFKNEAEYVLRLNEPHKKHSLPVIIFNNLTQFIYYLYLDSIVINLYALKNNTSIEENIINILEKY
jgi:hypothetical protein